MIKEDLQSIKEEFAVERRTKIEDGREAVYDETAESARPGVFVLDKFGYCKILEPSIYERNRETVDTENVYVLPCHTTDKIGLFTDLGAFHQVKVTEIPFGKLRDKGVPIDNLSKFDATKERPVCVVNAAQLKGQKLLFATKDAMIKIVPGGEFETNNRTVAATKLQENDMLLSVQPADGMKEAVIQTTSGIFLRFPIEEISEMKKNAKGVRGIKLGRTESLRQSICWTALTDDPIVMYKEKPVHLSRLKIGYRDGKGNWREAESNRKIPRVFTEKRRYFIWLNFRIHRPHIGAKQGEIAETILLPGDPLRAKYIAEHFLTDAKQFNTTRNSKVIPAIRANACLSCGDRHGCPSMGIYSYELISLWMQESDPDRTAGALRPR
ncbi:MAG: DNA gyrase C-terminal beta-propeller domain-containing protein [Clostridium fessum]